MTVMIPEFFGMPHSVIRDRKLKNLSGVALRLYIALWHESERYCTRELTRTTKALIDLVGGARNSHNKARAELVRAGLVIAASIGTEGFIFHLCDPKTGKPWPLDPRVKVAYQPKGTRPVVGAQGSAESRKPSKIDNAGTSFAFGWSEDNCPPPEPQRQESINPLTWEEIGHPRPKPRP